MNILLWVLQGLLASMMLMPGLMKLTTSKADLKVKAGGRMDWVDDVSAGGIKVIGLLEFLAGLGLILPHLLGILPWLTPVAAVGVVLTMVGAAALHLKRKDPKPAVIVNIVVLTIAVIVALGRFLWVPAACAVGAG